MPEAGEVRGRSRRSAERARRRAAALPRPRNVAAIDAAVVVWTIVWIVLGIWIAAEVRDLGRVGGSVARVGDAIVETGTSLEQLGDLPLVGESIADAGAPVREAGEAARASAVASRESANQLAVLLGLAIALVPTVPMLLLYVPQRIDLQRDRRAVLAAMREGDDLALRETLAHRAVAHLPYHRLQQLTPHPERDLAAGRFDVLARAELRRLGLSPRRRSTTAAGRDA